MPHGRDLGAGFGKSLVSPSKGASGCVSDAMKRLGAGGQPGFSGNCIQNTSVHCLGTHRDPRSAFESNPQSDRSHIQHSAQTQIIQITVCACASRRVRKTGYFSEQSFEKISIFAPPTKCVVAIEKHRSKRLVLALFKSLQL